MDTFEECAPQRNDTVGRMAQRALLMRGDSAMQVFDAALPQYAQILSTVMQSPKDLS